MPELTKGQNVPLEATVVRATLSWTDGPGVPRVDIAAVLLGADGRAGSDDDFVFYNQPRHPSGAVSCVGSTAIEEDAVDVDLTATAAAVDRIVVAASVDGGPFGQVPDLCLTLTDRLSGVEVARFPFGADQETAILAGEIYRRAGSWKFRAVGQGYGSGLAGVAADFVINLGEDELEEDGSPPDIGAAQEPIELPTVPGVATPAHQVDPPVTPITPSTIGAALIEMPPAPETPTPSAPSAEMIAATNLDEGQVALIAGRGVALVKVGNPITLAIIGFGWGGSPSTDDGLDVMAVALDQGGQVAAVVTSASPLAFGRALQHTGSHLTIPRVGDDKQLVVDLPALPQQVVSIVFAILSMRDEPTAGSPGTFCRLVNGFGNAELVRFDLPAAEPRRAVLITQLRRGAAAAWELAALGRYLDGGVDAIVAAAAQG